MKKYLITGLIILLPVALTFFIFIFLFDFFTEPFADLFDSLIHKQLELTLPPDMIYFLSRVLSLISIIVFIFVLGVIARWFLIKNFLNLANRILSKIPLVKTIYKISRDIISALFSMDGKKAFKGSVMIPFPFPPAHAVGFEAGEVAEEIQQKVGKELVSIFAPTAPHPISGFLFFVPKEDAKKIEMKNEETIKFLVSCGMIYPKREEK